jgi:hypothetical protein
MQTKVLSRPLAAARDRQLSGRPATNPPRQSTSAAGTASLLGALVMADDFVLMHDVENACAEFAQSLETYAEFLRRHPGTEVENGKSLTAAARVVRTDFPAG